MEWELIRAEYARLPHILLRLVFAVVTCLAVLYFSPGLQRNLVEAELGSLRGVTAARLREFRVGIDGLSASGVSVLSRRGGWQVESARAEVRWLPLAWRRLHLEDAAAEDVTIDFTLWPEAELAAALPALGEPGPEQAEAVVRQAVAYYLGALRADGWSYVLRDVRASGTLYFAGDREIDFSLNIPVATDTTALVAEVAAEAK